MTNKYFENSSGMFRSFILYYKIKDLTPSPC